MMSNLDSQAPAPRDKRYLVLALPTQLPRKVKQYSLIAILIVGTNVLSHRFWNADGEASEMVSSSLLEEVSPLEELYLMDKARSKVSDPEGFAIKVQEVSGMLGIPPEWLMAVMYAESSFNPSALNHKGSGATGLIQFMPATAAELGVSLDRLRRMDAVQQLEYVYLYLQTVRERYGDYQHLTDLYLAILFPRARGQDYCFTLYARPTQSYLQNAGLDEDKDGRVTVSDIDRHLKRMYPKAYMTQLLS
jgi:hypothetical protein